MSLRVRWYLESRGLYPEDMTGFRSGWCVTENVVHLVTSAQQGNFYRKTIIALFLYIKKAYDLVEHNAIVKAITQRGLGGKIFS